MHARQRARRRADGVCRTAQLASGFAACEPAHEQPAGVPARIELAGGDHLVLDAALRQRALDRLDHVLLGHSNLLVGPAPERIR